MNWTALLPSEGLFSGPGPKIMQNAKILNILLNYLHIAILLGLFTERGREHGSNSINSIREFYREVIEKFISIGEEKKGLNCRDFKRATLENNIDISTSFIRIWKTKLNIFY